MRKLGLWPGVGLVAANMIGAGVFLSAGFMAQDMGPGPILLAWLVGAVLALAGATAYAAVARLVPRSGGEYRYLSELLHPALGYLAGWTSLLVGFSAPIAVDALAAGAFSRTLFPGLDPRWVGAVLVVALTAVHAVGLRTSARVQNLLVLLKVVLLLGFVALGLVKGSSAWPTWAPPGAGAHGFPLGAFVGSLFYIAFAFSGWNAAIYAAEEFETPEKTVPRAMLIGCGLVAVLYLIVNWIFVANLTPQEATAIFSYSDALQQPGAQPVTLGHLIVRDLAGEGGGKLMSIATVIVFVSAMSAMTFVGPRIYAAMARDGFLPKALAGAEGRPPVGSVLLQGALALVILFTHSLQEALGNVGAILVLFAALTVLGLFRVRFARPDLPRPSALSLAAAALYVVSAAYMLYFGFKDKPSLLVWIGVIVAVALGAYAATLAVQRARRTGGSTG